MPRFFDYNTRLSYSQNEQVDTNDEVKYPTIRNAMQWSFAVGMLEAFYALKGQYAGKRQLADDAIYLERELCKEAGGKKRSRYLPRFLI